MELDRPATTVIGLDTVLYCRMEFYHAVSSSKFLLLHMYFLDEFI